MAICAGGILITKPLYGLTVEYASIGGWEIDELSYVNVVSFIAGLMGLMIWNDDRMMVDDDNFIYYNLCVFYIRFGG